MSIAELQKEAYRISKEHGFHDGETPSTVPIPEKLCLIHSEVSEALESVRNGEPQFHIVNGKPEGIAAELADVVIRVLDLSEAIGINLSHAIAAKMEYNRNRPMKHGKRF